MTPAPLSPAPPMRALGGLLRPNPVPLAWRTTCAAFAGLLLATLVAWALGIGAGQGTTPLAHAFGDITSGLPAGIVALFVVLAGLVTPRHGSLAAIAAVTGLMLLAMLLALASLGHPWRAGVVMGAVMLIGPLAARRGGAVNALSGVLGPAYVIIAILGPMRDIGAADAAAQTIVGAACALMVLTVVWISKGTAPRPAFPGRFTTGEWSAARASRLALVTGGSTLAYAIARGGVLGGLAAAYSATQDVNLVWVFLTVWSIMLPVPDRSVRRAIQRVAGVMAGCLLVATVGPLLPAPILLLLGLVCIFVGFLWRSRSYAVYAASVSVFSVALAAFVGEPGYAWYGTARIVDTIIGAVVGLGLGWLTVGRPAPINAELPGTPGTPG